MSESPRPWFHEFTEFHCRDCGSDVAFRSRRRSLSERYLLPLLLLRPVRCGECFRRDYRWIFANVKERLSDISGLIPVSKAAAAGAKRNIA